METVKITRGWPPSRRAAQAERCRRQQPWRFSTGPRTAAGKAICARNAHKHGRRGAFWNYLKVLLCRQRDFVRQFEALSRRHCERSEAIQEPQASGPGLLRRYAPRNDGGKIPISDFRLQNSAQSAYTYI